MREELSCVELCRVVEEAVVYVNDGEECSAVFFDACAMVYACTDTYNTYNMYICIIYGLSIRRGKARQGKARYARESGHGLCIYVSKYLSIQVYIYCRKAGGRESGVGSGSGESF